MLNILKIAALVPSQLPFKFMKYLSIFIKFKEDDTYGLFPSSVYEEEYIKSHTYIPRNSLFKFESVYPKMRATKILMRMIINLFYIFFLCKMKRSGNTRLINHMDNRKKTRSLKLRRLVIRMLIGVNHTNLGINIILLSTSMNFQLSRFDFLVILLDLICLIWFQVMVVRLYNIYKRQPTKWIPDKIQLEVSLAVFYMQKSRRLTFPYQL
jgi:hypothetical protein